MFYYENRLAFKERGSDILTVGEMLVDMISEEYDDTFESGAYQKFFGGSPSNIAMNVKQLGIRPLVAAAVGRDGFGTFLINQLKKAGIETDLLQQADASTSMVVVTKSRSTPIPIFYRGADQELTFSPSLRAALQCTKIVHFSCWPISIPTARSTIERVIGEARDNGVLIGFDPNYHPLIWQRGEDGIAIVKSFVGQVDIIKPSEDDAERLFGKDSPENQIEKFLELGAKLVIMTLGADGALVSNGSETLRFDTLATEVKDTTGAGDAFWSGFYTALIRGYTIRQSLHLGFAVSAYKLRFTGAVAPLQTLEEIGRLYDIQEARK
ncbi:carbohydrate kinase family protein [Paenibacillus tianjinensis]|uniref:Sugar kinase n=1 Tax=Paenibacillus tianjinensis TaxID=2810347 RepID=A0ABX7LD43_9BACL|nr:sugar kinase [Paenibacillus tianjinensis]QSF45303.1 sugar kinase [Paenibacillus tianjinensis]